MSEKKSRDSNIELLRVLCMYMMTVQHYIARGGIYETYGVFNFNNNAAHLLRSIGFPALAAFALISGYYMFGGAFKFHRVGSVLTQSFVYENVLRVIGVFLGAATLKSVAAHFAFGIFSSDEHWYVMPYVGMCLTTPFMDSFFMRLSKKRYQFALGALILLFFVIPSYGKFDAVRENQGVFTFVTLYYVGGYIRRFRGDLQKRFPRRTLALIILLLWELSYALYPIGDLFGKNFHQNVIGLNNIFALSIGVAIFLFFLECDIGSVPWLNWLSSHTFGVYLFHEHLVFRSLVWDGIAHREAYYNSPLFIPQWILWSLIAFFGGIVADILLKPVYTAIFRMNWYRKLCAVADEQYAKLSAEESASAPPDALRDEGH